MSYGQASEFRIRLGGNFIPEAQDYDPRNLPWDYLAEGNPPETDRLLHLAMANNGVHLFGAGGMTASVHTAGEIDLTIDAWGKSLEALRAEGAV
ncbi:MAG: hypothetical protein LC118_17800 [Dehalococcoidia bacterium]|nr:hypothetical protein [Dehalococcoidia bacterium]